MLMIKCIKFLKLFILRIKNLNNTHTWGRTYWGGALFLGCIGIAFWVIYLADRARWWGIIPGGVLLG